VLNHRMVHKRQSTRERTREWVGFESIPENSKMWRRTADCSRDGFRPLERHGRGL